MHKNIAIISALLFTTILGACNNNDASEDNKKSIRKTLVTTSTIQHQPIEVQQNAIGSLEGLIDPILAAEMAARVINVHVTTGQKVKKGQLIASLDATDYRMQRNEAQAEVARILALLENQTKTVARNQALVDKNFISQNAVDNDRAQENVLKQQLAAAKARVASINHDRSKSKISAPVSGIVEETLVDTGDYLRVGDPIVKIISKQTLRAHLPFPEQIGPKLKPGLTVRLSTPTSEETVETVIKELKPQISEGNRTIDVIVDINNAAGWQPGATVNGTVVLSKIPNAIMVPEQSLVMRPAGKVVYTVLNNKAHQSIVETGVRQNGLIEILSGLKANDIVVVDGAGFLTDKAPIKIATDDAS